MACKSSVLIEYEDNIPQMRCAEACDIRCDGQPQDKAECWRWSGGLEKQTFIRKSEKKEVI